MDMSVARKLALGNGILTVETVRPGRGARRPRARRQGRRRRARGADHRRAETVAGVSRAAERSAARLAAAQALYQMEVGGAGLADVLAEFESHWIGQEVEGEQYKPAEVAFFRDIVAGVLRDQVEIDRALDAALAEGWPLKRVEALMRAILRAGFYELRSRPDVPARAAIKEYVDVAGAFYGAEESGMINAVLDALARKPRPKEFA